ncbi:MAG: hypothetical protein Kow0063_03020 [Anaerolineae bacterium]
MSQAGGGGGIGNPAHLTLLDRWPLLKQGDKPPHQSKNGEKQKAIMAE